MMSFTTDLAVIEDPAARRDLVAVAGLLAAYGPSTRRADRVDLRLFADWCREGGLDLLAVRRSHLELYGRWMESRALMASTIARRLSTLAGFYRYCEQKGLVERSPAVHVRRPKLHAESRALGPDRTELSAFMIQAAIGSRRDHALASLPRHRYQQAAPDSGRPMWAASPVPGVGRFAGSRSSEASREHFRH